MLDHLKISGMAMECKTIEQRFYEVPDLHEEITQLIDINSYEIVSLSGLPR